MSAMEAFIRTEKAGSFPVLISNTLISALPLANDADGITSRDITLPPQCGANVTRVIKVSIKHFLCISCDINVLCEAVAIGKFHRFITKFMFGGVE